MAFLLMVPLFVIRFGLLAALDKRALARAARFPPLAGRERAGCAVYQISNALIVLYPFFLSIETEPTLLVAAGCVVYGTGVALLIASTVRFAHPPASGLLQDGVYRFSRNPMYVSYFLYFLGCALLAQSALLFALVLAFQVSAHAIIKAEERECEEAFGEEYRAYCRRVRRYV
ncbi:phospholipid methyltransferase [Gordonibacter sp. An230]|uniref:methyltransferase family protein n=1 Tax=Gordonibacter sp. An230 TaxID=1965592 RepID=UPI000B39E85A|nr:isoprenylcysteine carboxylmethyltransferase family protein [Gordonibacter sp. An230]OUO87016.1 phospholipid methyltransferase [Gordonibacter sp. An230]